MKTFKTQAEEKAYYSGARDMMRAFELADPSDYTQMLSAKNEQHIIALLTKVQQEQKRIHYKDISVLLKYCWFDKELALDFVLSDSKCEAVLELYSLPENGRKVTELRASDEAAIVGVLARFIEFGDGEIIKASIEDAALSDDRKNGLKILLSMAQLNAREYRCGMVFDAETIDDNGRPVLDPNGKPIDPAKPIATAKANIESITRSELPAKE